MNEPCLIRKGTAGRWFIFNPHNILKAWSGSQWVSCGYEGTPCDTQVSNFDTEQEARDYCREIGLEPQ